ncbi:MAG: hypothetical protein U0H79_04445 [Eubacterium sp.]|nr:hypothetical protein [Eubacterium sp.]DAH40770.1 MAG TPA: Maturase reverse transcriptase/DNA/RNA Complex II intron, retroelement, retrotransposition [Caudoviricetes sp.]DAO60500.1 MAG TPA: Maturase reverse transcriptase/DNA/RNA Complex II intron, retroelement, retrotransposition [Caudoviricetes sp.]
MIKTDSILQKDKEHCFLCGGSARYNDPLDKHHVFNASNRNKSEQYGLTVYLHHNSCHCFGTKSAHKNQQTALSLKRYAQSIAMKRYGWSIDDFIEIFGKNYI